MSTVTPPRAASRKSVLFCPVCDHEAPVDDDWSLDRHDEVDGRRTDVECPECGHVIVSQPEFGLLA